MFHRETAIVCENGHVIAYDPIPESDGGPPQPKFCKLCAAAAINQCANCQMPVSGAQKSPDDDPKIHAALRRKTYVPPAYCDFCGVPFEWTERRLVAAEELADIIEGLHNGERSLLKGCFPDLLGDTPRAAGAAVRLAQLCRKSGEVAITGFREILVGVISNTASEVLKKSLGW
jgi:hypothetical protein